MKRTILLFALSMTILFAFSCRQRPVQDTPKEDPTVAWLRKNFPDKLIITTQEQLDSLMDACNGRIAVHPTPEDYHHRASLHWAAGPLYDECLLDLDSALALLPAKDTSTLYYRILYFRACCYDNLKQYDLAEQIYKAILKDRPERQDVREALTELLLNQKRLREARRLDSISRITGIAPGSPYWYDPSWELSYSEAKDTLYYYPRDRKISRFTIPSSVQVIADRAFQCNKHLAEITIPENVREIGTGTFLWSKRLTSVTIKGPVESLPWRVFEGCPELRSVVLPETLTSLDGMTFSGCGRLECITIKNPEPPELFPRGGDDDTMWDFWGVNLSKCVVYVPSGSAEKYKSAEGWMLFKNIKEL